MKKNYTFRFSALTLIFGIALFVTSCDESEEVTLPEANFTTSRDGLAITFNNTSTAATSYSWDFGDGTTSDEESPVHEYEATSAYVVTLTATNAVGVFDASTQAIELSFDIVVDGAFDDWTDVPVLSERNPDTTGVVTLVKATSDLTNIYFYVEGEDELFGFAQLYLNNDGDSLTGFMNYGNHPVAGADLEMGGGTESAELFEFLFDADANPDRLDWSFNDAVDGFNSGAEYTPIMKTGNAYEFAVSRSLLASTSVEYVSFAVGDVNTADGGWSENGYLPNVGENYIELILFK